MSAIDLDPGLRPIDWLLGEGSEAERGALEAQANRDPGLTLELAETVEFLERLRALSIAPGPRLRFLLARLDRTAALRVQRAAAGRIGRGGLMAFVAAAALVFAALRLWRPLEEVPTAGTSAWSGIGGLDLVRHAAAPPPAPVQREESAVAPPEPPFSPDAEPRLYAALARLADRRAPDPLVGWIAPSNLLAVQRLEAELRGSAEFRRQALARSGANPDADGRVQQLAAAVAAAARARLDAGEGEPREIGQALRALVAAGSTPLGGPHAGMVASCVDWLLAAMREGLEDGDLVGALAALVEPAVADPEVRAAVSQHGQRLVLETVTARGRPSLLGWRTSVDCLADAGRVFAVLPAWGVEPELAFQARRLCLAHLEERRVEHDGPEILLAELYGYADLVDREELEFQVRAWRPAALLPDYGALQHLAWSREPGAPGWTRFQREMRRLAAVPTPAELADQSALLMSLATSFAAPGLASMLGLAD